jgi:replication-associated recombination protein RarA
VVRTYLADGELRLDAATLLHEIGHAYDLVMSHGGDSASEEFKKVFDAEHGRLPPYFHVAKEFFAEAFALYMLDAVRCKRELPQAFDYLDKLFAAFRPDTAQLHELAARQSPPAIARVAASVEGDPIKRVAFQAQLNRVRREEGLPTVPFMIALEGRPELGAEDLARAIGQAMSTAHAADAAPYRPNEAVVRPPLAAWTAAADMEKFLFDLYVSGRPALLCVDTRTVQSSSVGFEALMQHLAEYGEPPLVVIGEPDAVRAIRTALPGVTSTKYTLEPLSPRQQAEVVARLAAQDNFEIAPDVVEILGQRASGGGWTGARELWASVQQAQVARLMSGAGDLSGASARTITGADAAAAVVKRVRDPKAELMAMVGQKGAKDEILDFLQVLQNARDDEKAGVPQALAPRMNVILKGPPGTGKTTMINLAVEMLGDAGLLKSKAIRKVTIDELVAAPEQAVKRLWQDAKGGAIFIDEMHQLADTSEGQRALKALIPYLTNKAYADTAFFGAGYDEEITKLLHKVDKGAERRFRTVKLTDNTKEELGQILDVMAKSQGYVLDGEARSSALRWVELQRRLKKNFGNAGEVENALVSGQLKQAARLRGSDRAQLTEVQRKTLIAADFEVPPAVTKAQFWAEVAELQLDPAIVSRLQAIGKTIDLAVSKGKDPATAVEPYFVLVGAKGVGKTHLARLLARFGVAYGLIADAKPVETGGTSLQGRYAGQTAGDVTELVESAWGRLLFVDEVGALARSAGDMKNDATGALLKMTEDYRGKFMLVVADRPDGVADFFGLDSSMQSRFGTVLKLEPWTAARAAPALVHELAQKFDIDAKPLEKHIQSALTPLASSPDWASGRTVRTLGLAINAGVANGKALQPAIDEAIKELTASWRAVVVGKSDDVSRRSGGSPRSSAPVATDVLAAVKAKPAELTAVAELTPADRKVLDAIAAADRKFAATIQAQSADVTALEADPSSDYMKAIASALGVEAEEAVKVVEMVRVKVQKMVVEQHVIKHFDYHCPYCGQVNGSSCYYMKAPYDDAWRVAHSLKKPWDEVVETKKMVEVIEERKKS